MQMNKDGIHLRMPNMLIISKSEVRGHHGKCYIVKMFQLHKSLSLFRKEGVPI